jgi:hypothetical protein
MPRHQGVRCWGFLSSDGVYAHCTRAELAGRLPLNGGSSGYAHRLLGRCPCGHDHGADAFDAAMRQATRASAQAGRTWAKPRKAERPHGTIEAIYDYDGHYQVVRLRLPDGSKTFRQRRPAPDRDGAWIWNLDGVAPRLYHQDEIAALPPGSTVIAAEGEKDVDRFRSLGFHATCNSGGAGKWRAAAASVLRGHHVLVVPDEDEAGRRHAEAVARALDGSAASVTIVRLPGLSERGDASDWFDQDWTPRHFTAIAALAAQAPPTPHPDCRCSADDPPDVSALKALSRTTRALIYSAASPSFKVAQLVLAYEVHAPIRRVPFISLPAIARRAHVSEYTLIRARDARITDGSLTKTTHYLPANPYTGEVTDGPRPYIRIVPTHQRLAETLHVFAESVPDCLVKAKRSTIRKAPPSSVPVPDLTDQPLPCPQDGDVDLTVRLESVHVARCGECGLPLAAVTRDGTELYPAGFRFSQLAKQEDRSLPLRFPSYASCEKRPPCCVCDPDAPLSVGDVCLPHLADALQDEAVPV